MTSRFSDIDMKTTMVALELSRKLGRVLFLPLALGAAILSLITVRFFAEEAGAGHWQSPVAIWFYASFALMTMSGCFWALRGTPRPIILIPFGCLVFTGGCLLFAGWIQVMVQESIREDPFNILMVAIPLACLAFGKSLVLHGVALWRQSSRREP